MCVFFVYILVLVFVNYYLVIYEFLKLQRISLKNICKVMYCKINFNTNVTYPDVTTTKTKYTYTYLHLTCSKVIYMYVCKLNF